MKHLCHQRFPFLDGFSDSSSRSDHALHMHQRTSEHAIASFGFGPPVRKDLRLEGPIESRPPDTDSSLRSRIPGVFPKRVALPTGRRPKLVRHPHPWLCGATIAVPQAGRYEVVHSRITVVGHSEARLTIVASHTSTRTIRMRANRVEITHRHRTRGQIPPLFPAPYLNPLQMPSPSSSNESLEPRNLDNSLPVMAYHPKSTQAPPNGYPNQAYTPIAFNRIDGYLTKMFGRGDAAFFIQSLFKVNVRDVYLVGNVPGWPNAFMTRTPSTNDARVDAIDPNNRPLWLLDIIPPPMNHVVPQQMWTPPNQSDWRRYVEQANLRMPVFSFKMMARLAYRWPVRLPETGRCVVRICLPLWEGATPPKSALP